MSEHKWFFSEFSCLRVVLFHIVVHECTINITDCYDTCKYSHAHICTHVPSDMHFMYHDSQVWVCIKYRHAHMHTHAKWHALHVSWQSGMCMYHVQTCLHAYKCQVTYTFTYMQVHTCNYIHACTYMHVHTCKYSHAHIHTYICQGIYTFLQLNGKRAT